MALVAQLAQAAPAPPPNLDARASVPGPTMLSPGAAGAVSERRDVQAISFVGG
jgi:hypothetical protein